MDEYWSHYSMLKNLPRHYTFLLLISVVLSLYGAFFTHMNNWLIFKSSFFHLIDGLSLYQYYPQEHHDLFKYSPTFALLMAPLSILPAWAGATLWNLMGALLFCFGVESLKLSRTQQIGIFYICLPEFIGSTQGFQSNIHLVSFMMLFWSQLENQKVISTIFYLLLTYFIKVFGILGLVLYGYSRFSFKNLSFLFKSVLAFMAIMGFLVFLPALFIGFDSLFFQYDEWFKLLKQDASDSYGFSLMGFIFGLTQEHFDRLPWQVAGGLSLVGSILFFRNADRQTRMLGFISLCYFFVLFNHKSESPTFIIAMVGFALHQSLIENKKIKIFLITLTLGCVSLMYSDLFKSIKQSHLDYYAVKIWPFLLLYPLALLNIRFKRADELITKG